MTVNAARRRRVAVDGVLLLDKPAGITSQTAVSRVKGLFNAAKAGHTGTLDPLATGLLPVALGEATKFAHVLLDATKRYEAVVRLGTRTTTGDLEGEVTETAPVHADRPAVEAVLARFRGPITQTPPMYSALKHQGKALYEYARAGATIERTPRTVTLYTLELLEWSPPDLRIDVRCSKGTYIRVLAEDIGAALGGVACLAWLRRTGVGAFSVAEASTLDALGARPEAERAAVLRPVDVMLEGLPRLVLDAAAAARVERGQTVDCGSQVAGTICLYDPENRFLGIGESDGMQMLRPRRLLASRSGLNG